mmetsp:Transcript_13990/g.29210  ORF Transcript_13990/g.29210 Transcript_13990/m.29210 type:complete len:138 (-) Transcript_13990:107-520(-)
MATLATPKSELLGCCFSIGYGDYMKPCCLQTQRMASLGSCKVAHRLGGVTAFQLNRCPRNAREAGKLIQRYGLVINPEILSEGTQPEDATDAADSGWRLPFLGAASVASLVGLSWMRCPKRRPVQNADPLLSTAEAQ